MTAVLQMQQVLAPAEEVSLFSRGKKMQRRHPITGGLTLAGALMAFLFTKDKKQCFSCWEVQGWRIRVLGRSGKWSGEPFAGGPLRGSLAFILLLFVVV